IFRALKQFLSGDEPWDIELFQDMLDGQLHGRLARLAAYASTLPNPDVMVMREDAVKVLLRMRQDRLRAETTRIKYLLDEFQREGDQESLRSFDRINNLNLRELAHLQRVTVLIPQEMFRRNARPQAIKLS
ncbi:MAG: hypothetical protein KDE24_07200, partial [Caldilinea sp.]|nr:hypothetical protein [Caldilinea sp.]